MHHERPPGDQTPTGKSGGVGDRAPQPLVGRVAGADVLGIVRRLPRPMSDQLLAAVRQQIQKDHRDERGHDGQGEGGDGKGMTSGSLPDFGRRPWAIKYSKNSPM